MFVRASFFVVNVVPSSCSSELASELVPPPAYKEEDRTTRLHSEPISAPFSKPHCFCLKKTAHAYTYTPSPTYSLTHSLTDGRTHVPHADTSRERKERRNSTLESREEKQTRRATILRPCSFSSPLYKGSTYPQSRQQHATA